MFLSLAQLFLSLLTLSTTYFVLKFLIIPYYHISSYRKQGIPSSFYPLLGMLKRYITSEKTHKDTMYHYRNLAKTRPNTRAEVINFGSRICLILYDPKLIKEFYNNPAYYNKVSSGGATQSLMGTGLLLTEGEKWKKHRRIISNVFHYEFLKDNIPVIVSTTREYLQELKSNTTMKEVNIMNEIQKITGEVVGRIFFGKSLNQYKIDGIQLTLYLAQLVKKFEMMYTNPGVLVLSLIGLDPEWVPEYKKYMRTIREFREICLKIVQDRKRLKENKGSDLLGLLLETQKGGNPEDVFSDEDIVNEFVTLFVAGMDTTGHLITMALYLLDKYPGYNGKLEQEIKEQYSLNDIVSVDSLNKMDMLHGIIKEALRLYTPAPIIVPRQALEDHNLLDVKVRKGMTVRPTPLYNYSNENYFKEAERFRPERWSEKKDMIMPFVDIPFSAGARNCIGQHLAMTEAKVVLSEFVKMFNFKVVPEDYELVMRMWFLYEPKEEILMDLTAK